MTKYLALLDGIKKKLEKSLDHLEYSYQKVNTLTEKVAEMDDETMEVWESFTARLGRSSDIFLNRYLRTILLLQDPGYEGSLRDSLNKAAKMGMISDIQVWLEIRELRNVAVHDYNDNTLSEIYHRLKEVAPLLLSLRQIIQKSWFS